MDECIGGRVSERMNDRRKVEEKYLFDRVSLPILSSC